jgi:phosphate:Na+ symporter
MDIAIGLIGGLGLFLYGMKIMGDGLEKAAGEKLKRLIEILTNNKIMGVIVGIIVTGVIQSSSATTVMVVGFVNAGIMKISQAVGVIMGANIGTTVTGQLVSLNLADVAPVAVGVGVAIWLVTKKKKVKQLSEILIGFGILFIGMHEMSNAMKPLREYEGFTNLLASFGGGTVTDTFFGILAGFGLTAIIQSSSASIGILIALASQGILPISAALPILYGDNIGTTVTAMLSSIGANKNAKKAAFIHFMFNAVGTLIFAFILGKPIMNIVTSIDPGNTARQIANAHTLFNITNVLIQLPFAGVLVFLANRFIKDENKDGLELGVKYLDDRMLETPSIALGQAVKETLHMGNISLDGLNKSYMSIINRDLTMAAETFKNEEAVNRMEREIASYLVKLSNSNISEEQHEVVDSLFNTINDIERISDHADNIAELSNYTIERNIQFNEETVNDLKLLFERVSKSFGESLDALRSGNTSISKRIIEREGEIDMLQKNMRAVHISRMNKQQVTPEAGVIFLDLISNLERIGDHANKIAMQVIDIDVTK